MSRFNDNVTVLKDGESLYGNFGEEKAPEEVRQTIENNLPPTNTQLPEQEEEVVEENIEETPQEEVQEQYTLTEDNIEGGEEELTEEGPSGDQGEEGEEPEIDNPMYYFANQLKEEGWISEDTEIGEDADPYNVYESIKKTNSERLYKEIENNFLEGLKAKGVTEDHLVMAMSLNNGVAPEVLTDQRKFKHYSSLDTEEIDLDKKREIISEYKRLRNLTPTEIEASLDRIEAEESWDDEVKTAQNLFKEKSAAFDQEQLAQAKQKEKIALARQAKVEEAYKDIFINRNLRGQKLSDQDVVALKQDLSSQTETVRLETGEEVKASPLQKFMYQMENDLAFQIEMFKSYKYKDAEQEKLKKVAEKKAEQSFLDKIPKRTVKKSSFTRTKKPAKGPQVGQGNVVAVFEA